MKFLIILCLAVAAQASDYCKCTFEWHPHIKCHQSEYGSCPSDVNVLDITKYSLQILNGHNTRRNLLASGRDGFQPAARMASMRWSKELADLAKMHIETCSDDHDCHDTEKFPYSGQNLGWQTLDGRTPDQIIEAIMEGWWSEKSDCRTDSKNVASGGFINHFLAMASEKNSRIGCAAAIFTHNQHGKQLSLTCNYARGLLSNEPVYTPGQPASGCQKGNNGRFPNLCNQNEVYDHKPW